MTLNLNGKRFSPLANSDGGRVTSDAIFIFEQTENRFTADYSGPSFSDGHLIGILHADNSADLVYHSRSDEGRLEVGEAKAQFSRQADGKWRIAMEWRWLNGNQKSGNSLYGEL